MKNFFRTVFGVSLLVMPLLVSADIASSSLPAPVHVSPLNNAALTTSSFTSVDWSNTVVGTSTTPALYYYELSTATSTTVDGGFSLLTASSSLLSSSTILTAGTAEGVYYWHVRSADAFGNKGTWSTPWRFIVDNTIPTAPSNLLITASSAPIIIGTTTVSNGTQTWMFTPSVDNGSGVSKYQYNVSGTSTWFDNALATSFTTSLGVGFYTVSIRAFDRSGNMSTSTTVALGVTASSTTATTTIPVIKPSTTGNCKKGGWRMFSEYNFKNQGRCVSFVEKMLNDKKKENQESTLDAKNKLKEEKKMLKNHEDEQKKNTAQILKKAYEEKDLLSSSSTTNTSGKKGYEYYRQNVKEKDVKMEGKKNN